MTDKKLITGILIDVSNEQADAIEIEDTLDTYYKMIDCNNIDIVRRWIGKTNKQKKKFGIVCDDEGLLKKNFKPSAINKEGHVQLVGNLFICGIDDEDGELTSLTDADITFIKNHIKEIGTPRHPFGYPMLTYCS